MVGPVASLAFGMGVGAGYSVFSQLINQSARWIGWNAISRESKIDLLAGTMESLISAEKDPVSGLSTKGQVETMLHFLNKTVDFSVWIGESIASQLFVQMIQQSIAYAIHASHAGSVGTVANVYSGGMFLSGAQSSEIGENIDLMDRATRGFLSAEVGQNIPTLAFNLVKGTNRRIDEVYRSLMRNVDGFLDEWNDLTLSYYRQYHSMCRTRLGNAITMKESVVTRAYGLLEQVANEHLARISEQLDTIEGAKAWFDAGLMSSDDLKLISIQVDLERVASENNWDEYRAEILSAITAGITEWDTKITQALNDLKDTELRYALLINNIFSEVFTDVFDFVTNLAGMVDRAIEDTGAYRNVKVAVEAKVATEIGVMESSPETELYRLTYKRWSHTKPITVVYEYQRPHGLRWSEDLEHDKGIKEPVIADVVPRRKFEEVDEPIIKPYTEPTPLIPWISVE